MQKKCWHPDSSPFFSSLLHFLILVDTFRNQERRRFYWASMTSPTVNTTFSISLSYKYVLGRQARPEVINCIINQETKEIAIQVTIHCTADMATVAPVVSESRRSHPIILTNKVLDHPLYYSSRSACSVNKRTVAKDPSEVPFAYQWSVTPQTVNGKTRLVDHVRGVEETR